ncbi:MAG TPA: hypothetical protein VKG79_14725 [Bryobacteraceae bacterium]|nr:hypothetical protein [Bryobacteraceae bacterium]
MSRRLVLALLLAAVPAPGAIWPDKLGPYFLQPLEVKAPAIESLMAEYGAEAWEGADYGQFHVSAWRFKDTTGAYAASLEEPGLRVGNYLVRCSGNCPKDLTELADRSLPHVSHTPVPILGGYFPHSGEIAGSARYIMGPEGLQKYLPQISSGAVALEFGAEGQVARYRLGKGEAALAIFSYPTLEMARDQAPVYGRIPGVEVKRTGSLVALVAPLLGAQRIDPEEAKKLLGQVNYQASVAWNEPLPLVIKPQTAAEMVLGILTLAGIVLGFCLVSGLVFAVIRVIARRFGYSGADGSMTTLHLGGK